MRAYEHILRAVYGTPWAIQPEKLDAIVGFLLLRASGGAASEETLAEIRANRQEMSARRNSAPVAGGGSVAVLPLYGLISHRAGMVGDMSAPEGTSTEKFGAQFRQAVADPGVKAIVIDVDSPGGTVDGVPELAAEIFEARDKKPITAVANSLMASAAYWIGCAAGDLAVSPSAVVGSVGVYTAHQDESKYLENAGVKTTLISAGKYKTEANPYEPLGDEARAAMQQMVNDYYSLFVKAVAKGRGVNADAVRGGFGEGRVVTAQQAVKLGMADRVATLDQVLSKYGVGRANTSPMRAEIDIPEIAAADVTAVHASLARRIALAEV